MPGLIIDDQEYTVPGLEIFNYLDDSDFRLKLGEDGKKRREHWIRSIGVHSTKGIPGGTDKRDQLILPGLGASVTNAERVAKFWSTDPTQAGAHLVVDHDGTIICLADLMLEQAFHAGASNYSSIGIEVYQGSKAEFYDGQLDRVVTLIDAITYIFTEVIHGSIQRQFTMPYIKYQPMSRMDAEEDTYCGIYGHRDQTGNRGPGDPGDWLAAKLSAAGYESFNFRKNVDRDHWRERQEKVHVAPDGIPGPATAKALREAQGSGLWVSRPIDAQLKELYLQG